MKLIVDIKKSQSGIAALVSIALCSTVLAAIFLSSRPWPVAVRDYLEAHGQQESGAQNLVSAIYLGYRLYDTLGETIVLLVAVSGTILMLKGLDDKGYAKAVAEEGKSGQASRTDLIEVVAAKLGPVVLVFGFYVMLFGHISPGGGFQGGVVIASGIVFLALGNRRSGTLSVVKPRRLAQAEALAFVLLLAVSALGAFMGQGFFTSPAKEASPVGFIIVLNAIIGLKVGAGIAFLCLVLMGETLDDA